MEPETKKYLRQKLWTLHSGDARQKKTTINSLNLSLKVYWDHRWSENSHFLIHTHKLFVLHFGTYLFTNCCSLLHITYLNLPSKWTTIWSSFLMPNRDGGLSRDPNWERLWMVNWFDNSHTLVSNRQNRTPCGASWCNHSLMRCSLPSTSAGHLDL